MYCNPNELLGLCDQCEAWDNALSEAHDKLHKLEQELEAREKQQTYAERCLDESSKLLDDLERLVNAFERISGPVPDQNLTESMLAKIAGISSGLTQEEDESRYEPENLQDMLRTLAFLQGRLLVVKRALSRNHKF